MVNIDIITRIMNNKIGRIVISCILGLGLAALFQKACIMRDCIIIKGPEIKSIRDKVFKFEDKCYKYTPIASSSKK